MRYLMMLCLTFLSSWGASDLSSEETAAFLDSGDAVLIDIRTPAEWRQTGIVPQSHPIMYFDDTFLPHREEFLAALAALLHGDKSRPLIVMCRSGQRSKLVTGILEREGYGKIYNHKNGINEWIAEKRPLVRQDRYACCP